MKFDEDETVCQSINIPLTTTERMINPENVRFLSNLVRNMIAEVESRHTELELKQSGWNLVKLLQCRIKIVEAKEISYHSQNF